MTPCSHKQSLSIFPVPAWFTLNHSPARVPLPAHPQANGRDTRGQGPGVPPSTHPWGSRAGGCPGGCWLHCWPGRAAPSLGCSAASSWAEGETGQQVSQGTSALCPQGVPQGHSPSQIRAWGTHHRGPQLLSHCSSLEAMGEDRNSLPGLRILPAPSQGTFVTFPQVTGQAPSNPPPGLKPLPHGDSPGSHPRMSPLPSSLSGSAWWASVYFVLAVTR